MSNNENLKKLFIDRYKHEKVNKKILYIHIPYCISKCKFCGCQSIVAKNAAEIDNFATLYLPEQIKEYFELLELVSFEQVYFGGGSPNLIQSEKMERILNLIPNFESIPIKCIECVPHLLSESYLKMLRKYKFTFISLGIQSLQEQVCKWQNRFYMTKERLLNLSMLLEESGIYFHYDFICYLGKGDIRDITAFKQDLVFIMKYCRPTSITIQQNNNTFFSETKTLYLMRVIKDCLTRYPEYECINALLNDEDIVNDTMYQAEYRLVRKNRQFSHYMWNKYPQIPVKGFDILSLGYMNGVYTKSNVNNIVYNPAKGAFKIKEFEEPLYEECEHIKYLKGLNK